MPFDIADELICEMENKLGATFPAVFHQAMSRLNGGSFDGWDIYPVPDTSSPDRQELTHNNIIFETREAQDWDGLPEDVIALAGDGFGDQAVVLLHADTGTLGDEIKLWSHKTGELSTLAPSWTDWFAMRDARKAAQATELGVHSF